jgi:glutaminyl-peptide cyclotransferase
MRTATWRNLVLISVASCCLSACESSKRALASSAPNPAQTAPPAAAAKQAETAQSSNRTARPVVNGTRAMQYVKELVAFGPRYLGSPGHLKVESYLRSHLKSDDLQEDPFTVDSPEGKFQGRNFIAKFPGSKDGIIVVASHYDTNYPLRNTTYAGANDGGSTSALLLELAQHLRGKKLEGYSVWLVWTDAEEAVRGWTHDQDSVYGSRHLAETWEKDGTLKKMKAFLLADMIGDADLNVDRDANSTPWLEDLVLEAATRLGYQSHFFARTGGYDDDHTPFAKRGVSVADLIDLDYGYNNVFWHTPQDTVDKLSPRSIEIAGDVIYETVLLIGERK